MTIQQLRELHQEAVNSEHKIQWSDIACGCPTCSLLDALAHLLDITEAAAFLFDSSDHTTRLEVRYDRLREALARLEQQ